jgi:hypothetical protein
VSWCPQLGGPKDHKIEKEAAVVVLPEGVRVPLPCAQLPELVLNAVNTIAVSVPLAL